MGSDLLQLDPAAGQHEEIGGDQVSPEDEVRTRARERFAHADRILREIDDRWAPPPVDPVLIAQALGYRCVSVDEPGLDDAMIMVQNGTPTILFRRGRSRVRTRFSIFHELAHTLFPDYRRNPLMRGSKVRHFGRQGFLEHLCDVAAAEFAMPIDLFKSDRGPRRLRGGLGGGFMSPVRRVSGGSLPAHGRVRSAALCPCLSGA